MADQAFTRVHAWFAQAVDDALSAPVPSTGQPIPAGPMRDALRLILWSLTDPVNRNAVPTADPAQFNKPNIAGTSLSIAAIVVGEGIAAIDPVKKVLDALAAGNVGDAKDAIKTLVDQIKRAIDGARVHPSAFALGKLVMTLTKDLEGAAPAASAAQAPKLGELLVPAGTAENRRRAASAIAVTNMVLGAVLDTAFDEDPAQTLQDWAAFAAQNIGNSAAAQFGPRLRLPTSAGVLDDGQHVTIEKFEPARGLRLGLATGFERQRQIGTSPRDVKLRLDAGGTLEVRWNPLPFKVEASGLSAGIDVALLGRSDGDAVEVPDPASDPVVRLEIKELGARLGLTKTGGTLDPSVSVRAKEGRLVVKLDDALLQRVLGEEIAVEFDVEALADRSGGFRFKDGTSLRVNLPIRGLPTGPFELQLVTLGVEPKDGFARVEIELSLSAGVDLGPFKGSVERIGARLAITVANGDTTLGFKAPTGMGLQLDAGPVKGGGYLSFDPDLGEYKGALELKLASIGVKALGMLNTKRPGNQWSLLLLLFGEFPPIQLSWGFVLTGVGGLLGVQHTADTNAMAQRLGDGGLDAVLFPKDVAANAPQIFDTLNALFPFAPGGFVIGPMLEVGWGTPTLVAVRLGILIEAGQVAMIGQLAVQVPPLVDKQLAILRLQIDFVGVIVFDPLKIGFDGRLRDSRVGFITLTGQFCFRAAFGDKPTFLLSAGGFHPRFADVPADVPQPFERIGAGFSIGIVGVSIKGYFAVTSATVQTGCEVKAWADVGVASFEAGLGFDAICYLSPKFYFEVDFCAWAHAEAFGIGFGVSLSGMLKGPGRWRIRGVGEVDLGWFGSVSVEFDESWGEDRDVARVSRSALAALREEAAKRDNWSVQLPSDGEHYVTVTGADGKEGDPLGHPLAALVFTQRTLPLNRRLDRLGEADVEGPRTLGIGGLTFNGSAVPGISREPAREHFAAAQFFALSSDEKLSMPSFERMDAGERLGADTFVTAPGVNAPVDWETRDLDPEQSSWDGFDFADVFKDLVYEHPYPRIPEICDWMLETGAAARTSLRDGSRLRPLDAQPLSVAEQAPVAVAQKRNAFAVDGVVAAGAWEARQHRTALFGGSAAFDETALLEEFELV